MTVFTLWRSFLAFFDLFLLTGIMDGVARLGVGSHGPYVRGNCTAQAPLPPFRLASLDRAQSHPNTGII